MAEGSHYQPVSPPEPSPTDLAGFYIPSSDDVKQVANDSLIYNETVPETVSHPSSVQHHGMFQSVTFSGLPDLEETELSTVPRFRIRANSAPSVLYHQVAMQLRSISDDYYKEYSSRQQDAPQHNNRRSSLPASMHHLQPPIPLHGPRVIHQRHRNTGSISEENSQDCVDTLPS